MFHFQTRFGLILILFVQVVSIIATSDACWYSDEEDCDDADDWGGITDEEDDSWENPFEEDKGDQLDGSKTTLPTVEPKSCLYNTHCTSGSWGKYSRCNTFNKKCECISENKTISYLINGTCQIDEVCESNLDCFNEQAICNNGRCTCMPNMAFLLDSVRKCMPVAAKLGDSCVVHEQCKKGSLGDLSKCNTQGQCECVEINIPGYTLEVVYYTKINKCFVKKWIFAGCSSDNECKASLGESAICGLPNQAPFTTTTSSSGKVCQCENTSLFSYIWNKCFPLATKLGEECKITEQCQRGALGIYSRCNEEGKCECFNNSEESEARIAYNEKLKKCFPREHYDTSSTFGNRVKSGSGLKCAQLGPHNLGNLLCLSLILSRFLSNCYLSGIRHV